MTCICDGQDLQPLGECICGANLKHTKEVTITTSNAGGVTMPLPFKGDNISIADFYLRSAKERTGAARTRLLAKAMFLLQKEIVNA